MNTKLNERGGNAKTARMLAWKQPFIQRVRNSSLVERPCAENVAGIKAAAEAVVPVVDR